MNILIIDDEKLIVKGLQHSLEQSGFKVFAAYDGKQALNILNDQIIDFILLDIMLPEIDGITLCKQIRQKSGIPIIMLTAKNDEIDKILGLEFGADDYVTKPFHTRELIARINAVYRRFSKDECIDELIEVSSLVLNTKTLALYKGSKKIDLTSKEYDLLQILMKSTGRVFTREILFEIVWNESLCDTRTVDMHISHLREKIEDDPSNPKFIKTKWGVGYFFQREGL